MYVNTSSVQNLDNLVNGAKRFINAANWNGSFLDLSNKFNSCPAKDLFVKPLKVQYKDCSFHITDKFMHGGVAEKRVLLDKKTAEVVKGEYLKPSEIRGVYDLDSIDNQGRLSVESHSVVDSMGNIRIRKKFSSLDNVETQYNYIEDPSGNRKQIYKIVDSDNKILMDDNKAFLITGDNTALSIHNGSCYELMYKGNLVRIKNQKTGKAKCIDLNKLVENEDIDLKAFLRRTSAEELLLLHKKGFKLNYIADPMDSQVWSDKTIDVSPNHYIVSHELGHVLNMDFDNINKFHCISENPKFRRVYLKETNDFVKTFGRKQQEYLKYFMDKKLNPNMSMDEAVAEAHAITSSYNSSEELAIRSQYFQQYFPRIIATTEKLMQEQYKNILDI